MKHFKTYTSYSIDDFDAAREFYTKKLDLDLTTYPESQGVLIFKTKGDTKFMLYVKSDHQPAGYTVLNFEVENIEKLVDDLTTKGVKFEHIQNTDEKGIADMGNVKAAWFKDPAGNWIGLFQGI